MGKVAFVLLIMLFSHQADSSLERAVGYLEEDQSDSSKVEAIRELIDDQYFYAAVSLLPSNTGNFSNDDKRSLDFLVRKIFAHIGFSYFENLTTSSLEATNSEFLHYIAAKKHFKNKEYSKAKDLLKRISSSSFARPYALLIEASILSIEKNFDLSLDKFSECIDKSESYLLNSMGHVEKEELTLNKDYCIIGIARTYFAMEKYNTANLKYLDLPKSSPVWPEIIFEEAWNSFHLNNYNRTLGKLVTYNSDLLEDYFFPEAGPLKAMSYMQLCLWEDAAKEVDNYYRTYQSDFKRITEEVESRGNEKLFFLNLLNPTKNGEQFNIPLLKKITKSIASLKGYRIVLNAYKDGKYELDKLNKIRNERNLDSKTDQTYRFLLKRQLQALKSQRDILNRFIKKRFIETTKQIGKSFAYMSYIKLEMLQRKRKSIYSQLETEERKRGDVKYLKRNEKQYFWSFNGEFWADELGDYVFALRSEC